MPCEAARGRAAARSAGGGLGAYLEEAGACFLVAAEELRVGTPHMAPLAVVMREMFCGIVSSFSVKS